MIRRLSSGAVLCLATSVVAQTAVLNPANGHLYLLTSAPQTIDVARAEAFSRGGHLVTVDDLAENVWLTQTFGNLVPYAWIGLSDEAQEGVWRWDDGTPFAFSAWCPGEPNNLGGEDHVHIAFNAAPSGCWNDADGNNPGNAAYGIIELPRNSGRCSGALYWSWGSSPGANAKLVWRPAAPCRGDVRVENGSPGQLAVLALGLDPLVPSSQLAYLALVPLQAVAVVLDPQGELTLPVSLFAPSLAGAEVYLQVFFAEASGWSESNGLRLSFGV